MLVACMGFGPLLQGVVSNPASITQSHTASSTRPLPCSLNRWNNAGFLSSSPEYLVFFSLLSA